MELQRDGARKRRLEGFPTSGFHHNPRFTPLRADKELGISVETGLARGKEDDLEVLRD